MKHLVCAAVLAFSTVGATWSDARAQASRPAGPVLPDAAAYVPEPATLLSQRSSEMRGVVERWAMDRSALQRRWDTPYSAERRAALRAYHRAWLARLDAMAFDSLSRAGQLDWILLKHRIGHELRLLDREERRLAETAQLLPFVGTVTGLQDARRRLEPIVPSAAADTLARLAGAIEQVRRSVEAGVQANPPRDALRPSRIVAFRAVQMLTELRRTMERWFRFYDGYDPLFTWWATAPYRRADSALTSYARLLREQVVGHRPGQDEPIVGDPIGREAVQEDITNEMLTYSPEELIAIAEREFAWCEAEFRRAARDMGLGDDWRAALERVKRLHMDPGRQPELVRDLAHEAVSFIQERNLITVPPLARDMWRMEMLSPQRQKEAPFFLGGEVIQVSFPTDSMAQEDKLMSMRGNNVHFSRATVHHELIPGHHLQGFMSDRHFPHRENFGTPFWTEGWAFYWETLLWDLGFPRGPEDRVGMLFWRMHRAARIMLSLGFHLGRRTPQECIDFLVDRVGHERANATAEVRRWFNGDYSPLYQVAYMIGGLQFRALHRELVQSGRMTDRQFHDAVLQSGTMPVEMVRAALTEEPLARDFRPRWRWDSGR
jgi:uncharacterized protein (DUF885 family)